MASGAVVLGQSKDLYWVPDGKTEIYPLSDWLDPLISVCTVVRLSIAKWTNGPPSDLREE